MKNARINTLFAVACCTLFLASCSMDPVEPETEIWSGTAITFEKADDTDPLDAANQDRLTDNVWITRGAGGQIYNIVSEDTANKDISPAGTEWALGTTMDLDSLTFGSFRSIIGNPQDVVGEDLVLKLVADDILIDLTFTKWSSGQKGGFAYERSTR